VQNSGGAQTGTYGPNAATPTSDVDIAMDSTSSDVPSGSESTGAASTETSSPDTPAPSAQPFTPTPSVPQVDSTLGENASVTAPPTTTADDSGPSGNLGDVVELDDATPINAATDLGETTHTQLLIASDDEDHGTQQFAANARDNFALTATQDTSLTAAQNPVQAIMAIPTTVINFTAGFVAAVLSPFLVPGPSAPAQSPLTLFAVLDWFRREIQRTFFNRSPNAAADVYTISEDVGLSGNLISNDADADGDPLTATLVTGPAHGEVALNPAGSFTYTPDANYAGTDTFTYKVSDETSGWHLHGLFGFFSADGGHTATATVTINVTAVTNNAPVAVDDAVITTEDTMVTFPVLGNDTDGDGDTLSTSNYTQPANGSVALNGNGTFSYFPNANFFGVDTFTYTVTDGSSGDTAMVKVTVNSANDMPVTSGDAYTVAENGTLTVSGPGVLSNDTDIDGDPLTAVLSANPSNGTVTLNPDGGFTYIPSTNFTGTVAFQYYANDGTTDGNPSFVNISVTAINEDVVARDDSTTTATNVAVTGNVLTNDIAQNPDGASEVLTVTSTGPMTTDRGGSVTIAADGSYTYMPASGFTGSDTFRYTVTDGPTVDVGQVSITVDHDVANIAPVANDDELSTPANTPLIITRDDVFGNDDDPDGDPALLMVALIDQPSHGTLGSDTNGDAIYTPDAGYVGTDTFTYQLNDGEDRSNIATVTITVGQAGGNIPPIANDDELSTPANTPLIITRDDLLGNDDDPDGDPAMLTVFLIDQPTHGTLGLDYNGMLVYAPRAGYVGTDTFTYQLNDGENLSNIATVTITVGEPADNTAPVPGYDSLATVEDTSLAVNAAALLANDFDADGDQLSVIVAEEPANGTLVLNPNGTYTYTPDAGFTGIDTFTYVAYDGTTNSDEASVNITVGVPPNSAPIAVNDTLTTMVNTPLTITDAALVTNDSDADGDELIAYVVSDPAHGTVEFDDQIGAYVYTPDTGFGGTDTFSYTAYDGSADSVPATVTITVLVTPQV
jgi:large repetitive protein